MKQIAVLLLIAAFLPYVCAILAKAGGAGFDNRAPRDWLARRSRICLRACRCIMWRCCSPRLCVKPNRIRWLCGCGAGRCCGWAMWWPMLPIVGGYDHYSGRVPWR